MVEIILLSALLLLPIGWLPWWLHALIILIAVPGFYAAATGVHFMPTSRRILKRMVEAAKIKKGEKVFDMGCGDGRFVFASATLGAKAVGYELSLPVFLFAKFKSLFYKNSRIEFKNFWKQDYADADVLFCFLLISLMQRFERDVWPTLKPGCRVVSHAFQMKGVKPVLKEKNVVMYVKGESRMKNEE